MFQTQPEVGHVYLGSRRHVLQRIFNDANEPFWRSAKQLEIGMVAPDRLIPSTRDRLARTDRGIDDAALDRLLALSGGHPPTTADDARGHRHASATRSAPSAPTVTRRARTGR